MLPGPSSCLLSLPLPSFSSLSPSSHRQWLSQPCEMRSQDNLISPTGILQQRQNQEKMWQGTVGAKGVKPERQSTGRKKRWQRGEDRKPQGSWSQPRQGPPHSQSPPGLNSTSATFIQPEDPGLNSSKGVETVTEKKK